jgi:hypothetical protein
MGRQSGYLAPKGPVAAAPAPDRLARVGLILCGADMKRARSAVTLTFDRTSDRDAFWDLAHKLREETQRS